MNVDRAVLRGLVASAVLATACGRLEFQSHPADPGGSDAGGRDAQITAPMDAAPSDDGGTSAPSGDGGTVPSSDASDSAVVAEAMDAAASPTDSGPSVMDAGTPATDAGPPPIPDAGHDAYVPPADAGQCSTTGCPGDQDCDYLPDARDPAPTTCNAMLFRAEFATADTTGLTVSGAAFTHSGGALRFTDTTMGGSIYAAEVMPAADYLVEARVVFRATGASPWSVGIRYRTRPNLMTYPEYTGYNGYATCEIWYNTTYVSQSGPHMNTAQDSVGSSGTWNPGFSLPASSGQEYFLQSRIRGTGSARCGYWDSPSTERTSLSLGGVPTRPGTVGVYLNHVDVEVDYIRVFAY